MAGTVRRGKRPWPRYQRTRPWKNYADSIGCDSKTIAMLMALNDPERIKAEIQQEGRLQQQLRNASNPLERLLARINIS